MKIFATGNQQFGRRGAIKKFDRPFESIQEMNNHMIGSWNSVVSDDDHVYVIGNFAWDPMTADEMIGQLNGTIYLVRGEYDSASEDVANLHEDKFSICENDIQIDDENGICISHWPLHEWYRKDKGYHLVTAFPDKKYKSNHNEHIINVNCDDWSFKPVELKNIKKLFDEFK